MQRLLFALVFPLLIGILVSRESAAFSRSPGVAHARTQDQAKLLQKFKRAQAGALRNLKTDQAKAEQNLKKDQKQGKKDWERREKEERRKFFDSHKDGPSRRAYVQEFLARRKAFADAQDAERGKQMGEAKERLANFQEDSAEKLKEFEKTLDEAETPPDSLWPGGTPPLK